MRFPRARFEPGSWFFFGCCLLACGASVYVVAVPAFTPSAWSSKSLVGAILAGLYTVLMARLIWVASPWHMRAATRRLVEGRQSPPAV